MSKKHDNDFLMSRKYATFVANEYAKRIEKAIEYINEYKNYNYSSFSENEIEIELINKILNILKGKENE